MKRIICFLATLGLMAGRVLGQGTLLWSEAVNGPLSQDFSSPTALAALQLGTNSIVGQTEVVPVGPNWEGHPDIFTIQVPAELRVTAVYLNVDKPNVWAWIGDPSFITQFAFKMNPANGELLAQWSLSSISLGGYGMYLDNHDQQAFTSIANYRLDFFVQSIPEPGVLGLGVLGGLALTGVRRARSTSRR